jgi:hypothetical protein
VAQPQFRRLARGDARRLAQSPVLSRTASLFAMSTDNRWESFRRFGERGAAEALCVQLQHEGVPCKVEARALECGIETHYWVLVSKLLAHRARWITAQLPPSEEELTFLATGKLPGQE